MGGKGEVSALKGLFADTSKKHSDNSQFANRGGGYGNQITEILFTTMKNSSSSDITVFDLDNSGAPSVKPQDQSSEYKELINDPLITVISEEGKFCTDEEQVSEFEKTKFSYYKLVIRYREIDKDVLIKNLAALIKESILSYPVIRDFFFPMEEILPTDAFEYLEQIQSEVERKENKSDENNHNTSKKRGAKKMSLKKKKKSTKKTKKKGDE